jgi:hypothetical protein
MQLPEKLTSRLAELEMMVAKLIAAKGQSSSLKHGLLSSQDTQRVPLDEEAPGWDELSIITAGGPVPHTREQRFTCREWEVSGSDDQVGFTTVGDLLRDI